MAKIGGLGLGKGLDALIGDSTQNYSAFTNAVNGNSSVSSQNNKSFPLEIEVDAEGTLWINPEMLKPNPHQPRKEFDLKSLEELADSISKHGIVQPVIIEQADDNSFYIIAGERRTRAAKIAGLSKIPVQLRKYEGLKKLEIALIENIQRSDLNPIEEAQAYYDLMQLGGLSQEETALRVGKKRSTVANALRLLKLPEDMQKSLVNGQITAGHARALLSVVNPADQQILFGKIIGSKLSVREAESIAASYNKGGRISEKKPKKDDIIKDPDISSIEEKFIEILGTKVVVKGSLEKGFIQIDYFSKHDLERLYNVICKK